MHRAFIALLGLVAASISSDASATDFDAAIGRTGYGSCRMDVCSFFIIDAAAPVGSTKEGTLFALSDRRWTGSFKRRGDNDTHEYDRPPASVTAREPGITMVFCSKAKPVLFNFYKGASDSADLRPGDERAVYGYNESAYLYYYAACHHFITKDPVSKTMALRLGYTFANHPLKDGEDSNAGDVKRQPMDLLR